MVGTRGRRPGEVPKYTVGIAYVLAYRAGKNVEQIAKFFKATKNTVKQSLKRHGVDLEASQTKKIKKLQATINTLQSKLEEIKK